MVLVTSICQFVYMLTHKVIEVLSTPVAKVLWRRAVVYRATWTVSVPRDGSCWAWCVAAHPCSPG